MASRRQLPQKSCLHAWHIGGIHTSVWWHCVLPLPVAAAFMSFKLRNFTVSNRIFMTQASGSFYDSNVPETNVAACKRIVMSLSLTHTNTQADFEQPYKFRIFYESPCILCPLLPTPASHQFCIWLCVCLCLQLNCTLHSRSEIYEFYSLLLEYVTSCMSQMRKTA